MREKWIRHSCMLKCLLTTGWGLTPLKVIGGSSSQSLKQSGSSRIWCTTQNGSWRNAGRRKLSLNLLLKDAKASSTSSERRSLSWSVRATGSESSSVATGNKFRTCWLLATQLSNMYITTRLKIQRKFKATQIQLWAGPPSRKAYKSSTKANK